MTFPRANAWAILMVLALFCSDTVAQVADNQTLAAPGRQLGVYTFVPDNFIKCAPEWHTCTFFTSSTVVFYGANGRYIVRTALTSPFECTNAKMGEDPIPNTAKHCYVPAADLVLEGSRPNHFRTCAGDGGTCVFNGPTVVYYGGFVRELRRFRYVVVNAYSGIRCSQADFGLDPAPGASKGCAVSEAALRWSSVPQGYVRARAEGSRFGYSGQQMMVIYGARDRYVGAFVFQAGEGENDRDYVLCGNDYFGQDPVPGVVKNCFVPEGVRTCKAPGEATAFGSCSPCCVTCGLTKDTKNPYQCFGKNVYGYSPKL